MRHATTPKSIPFRSTLCIILGLTLAAPTALAQFQRTRGPDGGYVKTLAAKGSRLFAQVNGTVYRSSDQGGSWTETRTGMGTAEADGLAVFGDALIAGSFGEGIYRSTDDGEHWARVDTVSGRLSVHDFYDAGSRLYALTYNNGMLYSEDGGAHWTRFPYALPSSSPYHLGLSGNAMLLTTGFGIYRSLDGGAAWNSVFGDLYDVEGRIYADPDGPIVLIGSRRGQVFRSGDRGAHWMETDTSLHPKRFLARMLKHGDALLGAFSGAGVYQSLDSGLSWTPYKPAQPDGAVLELAESGGYLFAGTEYRGVFRLGDGENAWVRSNGGMKGSRVWNLALSGPVLFAAPWYDGVYRTVDGGGSYGRVLDELRGAGRSPSLLAANADYVFACAAGGGIIRSADRGAQWSALNGGLDTSGCNFLSAQGKHLYARNGSGLALSKDNGDNWTLSRDVTYEHVSDLAEIGGAVIAHFLGKGMHRSLDGGYSWAHVPSALDTAFFRDLFAGQGAVLAGTPNGMYRSADTGLSWSPADSGLPPRFDINAIAGNGDGLYAAGFQGVFSSRDGGISWTRAPGSDSLPEVLAMAANDSVLYLGTGDAGVWKLPLAGAAGLSSGPRGKPGGSGPIGTGLTGWVGTAAWVRPGGAIRFRLAGTASVDLDLYDLRGNLQATLARGNLSGGTHTAYAPAAGKPGVFCLRLRAVGTSLARRIVIAE